MTAGAPLRYLVAETGEWRCQGVTREPVTFGLADAFEWRRLLSALNGRWTKNWEKCVSEYWVPLVGDGCFHSQGRICSILIKYFYTFPAIFCPSDVRFFQPHNPAGQVKIWGIRRQLFVKYFRIIPWPTFIVLPWKKASLNSSTCLYRRPLPENEFPSFSKKPEPLRTAAPFQKWFPNNVVMPRLPGDPSLKQAALVFIITPAKYKEHGCFFDSKDCASCVSGRLHPL